jgi:hypothetical protein
VSHKSCRDLRRRLARGEVTDSRVDDPLKRIRELFCTFSLVSGRLTPSSFPREKIAGTPSVLVAFTLSWSHLLIGSGLPRA